MKPTTKILLGSCLEKLKELPEQSVQCCVTSPPYYGLRDYGTASWEGGDPDCDHSVVDTERTPWANSVCGPSGAVGKNAKSRNETKEVGGRCSKCNAHRVDLQIGMEQTPEAYVARMVEVFREVWRVLRDDGTLWLNLGDSYVAHRPRENGSHTYTTQNQSAAFAAAQRAPDIRGVGVYKNKDLIGIPWRVAIALQADGWTLRQDIIWAKTNPMPESVTDRCTKAHEYVFLLTKQASYFYDSDAVKEPAVGQNLHDLTGQGYLAPGQTAHTGSRSRAQSFKREDSKRAQVIPGQTVGTHRPDRAESDYSLTTRNKRSVWTVNTKPYAGAHFAVFPEALITPMILAGTSEKGCCPKCGAPWERQVETSGGRVDRPNHPYNPNRPDGMILRGGRLVPGIVETIGWKPTCLCADGIDRSLVFSPLGERSEEDDPSLLTGRAGMNRPRGNDEGQRPITRYEQAQYAAQIKASSHLEEMRAEAGDAFAHYVRTDSSGARPVPSSLLDSWIDKGWLVRVVIPELVPIEPVPCTVLDPFTGSGTTLAVSVKLGRSGVGCELNPEYIKLAEERILRARGGVPDPWDTDQEEIEAPESFDSMEDLFGL